MAYILAHYAAECEAFGYSGGAIDFYAFDRRDSRQLLSDWAGEYATTGNLVKIAARHYARDQRGFNDYFLFLVDNDRNLVPSQDASTTGVVRRALTADRKQNTAKSIRFFRRPAARSRTD